MTRINLDCTPALLGWSKMWSSL